VAQRVVRVRRREGLHARPAAALVRIAAEHGSAVWVARVGDPPGADADARSITEVLALGIRRGERVRVWAEGPDADGVLADIDRLLSGPEPGEEGDDG
jgi:phosphotransferase system HPr (HPr) family protein